jgi:hypothetical protein
MSLHLGNPGYHSPIVVSIADMAWWTIPNSRRAVKHVLDSCYRCEVGNGWGHGYTKGSVELGLSRYVPFLPLQDKFATIDEVVSSHRTLQIDRALTDT